MQDMLTDVQKMLIESYKTNDNIPLLFFDNHMPLNTCDINLGQQHQKEHSITEKASKNNTLKKDNAFRPYESLITEETLSISEVLDKCSFQTRRIYIEGVAGAGKSTLCRYIASEWANNAESVWRKKYTYLFWIKLRELPNYKGKNIYELVKDKCFDFEPEDSSDSDSEDSNPKAFLKNLRSIIKKGKNSILWLLDGYDELQFNSQSSNFINLEKIWKRITHSSRHIILTSRPGHKSELTTSQHPTKFNLELAVLGLNNQQIKKYAQKFFKVIENKKPEKTSILFLQQLKSNQTAWSLAQVPIQLELLCSYFAFNLLYNNTLSNLPTLTALYSEIIEMLLFRYVKDRCGMSELKWRNWKGFDKGSHQNKYQLFMEYIEHLAYLGMKNQVIYLGDKEITPTLEFISHRLKQENIEIQDFDKKIQNIGIIKYENNQLNAEFLHLTFQEFFAANYIVYEARKDKNFLINFVLEHKFNANMTVVFWFISGILAKTSSDGLLNDFYQMLFAKPRELGGFYELSLQARCIEESQFKSVNEIFIKNTIINVRSVLEAYIKGCIGLSYNLRRFFKALANCSYLVSHADIKNIFIEVIKLPDLKNTIFKGFELITGKRVERPTIDLDEENHEQKLNAMRCLSVIKIHDEMLINTIKQWLKQINIDCSSQKYRFEPLRSTACQILLQNDFPNEDESILSDYLEATDNSGYGTDEDEENGFISEKTNFLAGLVDDLNSEEEKEDKIDYLVKLINSNNPNGIIEETKSGSVAQLVIGKLKETTSEKLEELFIKLENHYYIYAKHAKGNDKIIDYLLEIMCIKLNPKYYTKYQSFFNYLDEYYKENKESRFKYNIKAMSENLGVFENYKKMLQKIGALKVVKYCYHLAAEKFKLAFKQLLNDEDAFCRECAIDAIIATRTPVEHIEKLLMLAVDDDSAEVQRTAKYAIDGVGVIDSIGDLNRKKEIINNLNEFLKQKRYIKFHATITRLLLRLQHNITFEKAENTMLDLLIKENKNIKMEYSSFIPELSEKIKNQDFIQKAVEYLMNKGFQTKGFKTWHWIDKNAVFLSQFNLTAYLYNFKFGKHCEFDVEGHVFIFHSTPLSSLIEFCKNSDDADKLWAVIVLKAMQEVIPVFFQDNNFCFYYKNQSTFELKKYPVSSSQKNEILGCLAQMPDRVQLCKTKILRKNSKIDGETMIRHNEINQSQSSEIINSVPVDTALTQIKEILENKLLWDKFKKEIKEIKGWVQKLQVNYSYDNKQRHELAVLGSEAVFQFFQALEKSNQTVADECRKFTQAILIYFEMQKKHKEETSEIFPNILDNKLFTDNQNLSQIISTNNNKRGTGMLEQKEKNGPEFEISLLPKKLTELFMVGEQFKLTEKQKEQFSECCSDIIKQNNAEAKQILKNDNSLMVLTDSDNNGLAHFGCLANNYDVVKFLIDQHQYPKPENRKGIYGLYPSYMAAMTGDIRLSVLLAKETNFLEKEKAPINVPLPWTNIYGWLFVFVEQSPEKLMPNKVYLTVNNQSEITHYSIKSLKNEDIFDKAFEKPIKLSEKFNIEKENFGLKKDKYERFKYKIIKLLLKQGDVSPYHHIKTHISLKLDYLGMAVFSGNFTKLKELLNDTKKIHKKGTQSNRQFFQIEKSSSYKMLFHLALSAQKHNDELLEVLLNDKNLLKDDIINYQAKAFGYFTPLALAIYFDNKAAAIAICDKIKTVEQSEKIKALNFQMDQCHGDTALHVLVRCAHKNWKEMIDVLKPYMDENTLSKSTNHDGHTPEQLAKILSMGKEPRFMGIENSLYNLQDDKERYKDTISLEDVRKQDKQIQNLVFEGGGPKGIVYVGAKQFFEKNSKFLSGLQRVAGTSAGAITALFFAFGLGAGKMQEKLTEMDMLSFMEGINLDAVKDLQEEISGIDLGKLKCYLVNGEVDGELVKEKGIYLFKGRQGIKALVAHPPKKPDSLELSQLAEVQQKQGLLEKLEWPSENEGVKPATLDEGLLELVKSAHEKIKKSRQGFFQTVSENWEKLKKGYGVVKNIFSIANDGKKVTSYKDLLDLKGWLALLGLDGLSSGNNFYDWIKKEIAAIGNGGGCMTFKEYREQCVGKKMHDNKETCKHLYIVTVTETGKILCLNSEDSAWDNYVIASAVRASMSIPFIFRPHALQYKEPQTQKVRDIEIEDKKQICVDGGVLKNYPVDLFDKLKFVAPHALYGDEDFYRLNKHTLGLKIRPEKIKDNSDKLETGLDKLTLRQLISTVVGIYYNTESLVAVYTGINKERTIEIDACDVGLLDFDVGKDKEKQKEMIMSGFAACIKGLLPTVSLNKLKEISQESNFLSETFIDENLFVNGLYRGKATMSGNNCLLHSYYQLIERYLLDNQKNSLGSFENFVKDIRGKIQRTNNEMLMINDEMEGVQILSAIKEYIFDTAGLDVGFDLTFLIAMDDDIAVVDNLGDFQKRFLEGQHRIPITVIQVNYNHYEPVSDRPFLEERNELKEEKGQFSIGNSRYSTFSNKTSTDNQEITNNEMQKGDLNNKKQPNPQNPF